MRSLDVHLVLSTRQADTEGFVPCKDVACMTAEEVDRILEGRIAERSGGYAFVVDGKLWVSLPRLVEQLVSATRAFLEVAEGRMERAANEAPEQKAANRAFLDRLRAAADALQQRELKSRG
jgi:hypothetical protein